MANEILTGTDLAADTESSRSTTITNVGDGLIALDVSVEVAFGASADAACILRMYGSIDGTNWDTTPIDSFTIPLTANDTVRVTRRMIPSAENISLRLYNSSSGQAVGGAFSVNVTHRTDQLA